jgi:hypothetical protein
MSKSGAIEHDYPVIVGRQINQTARLEILDHAAVAVKENKRPTIAAFHVVQTNPVDVEEPPPRRVIPLCFAGKVSVYDRCRRHKAGCPGKGGNGGISPEGDQAVGKKRGRTCLRKGHVQYLRWSARCLRTMRNVAAVLEPAPSSVRSYSRGTGCLRSKGP